MLWEGKPLREIREADVRSVIDSGLQEHLQLEYKSELYGDNHAGRRELLLDVCMFANTAGGILLIGVPERRDDGQPSGIPDAAAPLGLELDNPEATLARYDARVMEAIEERLSLESARIDVGSGRHVLAIRVPNSTRKPHSVRLEGHIYFPARRERQRYPMTVREIKELVMRTASQLEHAQQLLRSSFISVAIEPNRSYFSVGIIPLFFEDFLVDVRDADVRRAVAEFGRGPGLQYVEPTYSFDGLQRRERDYVVKFYRNGLLSAGLQLPLIQQELPQNRHVVMINAFDFILKRFVMRATTLFERAKVGAPYVLGVKLTNTVSLIGRYVGPESFPYDTAPIPIMDYDFPFMQVDDLSDVDKTIFPLCEQVHQTFGLEGSSNFNAEGRWSTHFR